MIEPAALSRFYGALEKLGQPSLFSTLNLRSLPERGIYFFYEDGEIRRKSGSGPRIVRVGTHALTNGSKSTLAQRLRQHRGSQRGGNHRGSIFRLLVGQALLSGSLNSTCPSWGLKGQIKHAAEILEQDRAELRSAEWPIEVSVSEKIGRMHVTILGCTDNPGPHSMRGYIERNAIALLSAAQRKGFDQASPGWLGLNSNRELVVNSGLWNQRHTTDEFDPTFLDRFEVMVENQNV